MGRMLGLARQNLVGVWNGMGRRREKGKVKGFVLSYEDISSNYVQLNFTNDHHAESVLRGLVHSGYVVTISEQIFSLPERLKAIEDYNNGWDGEEPDPSDFTAVPTPLVEPATFTATTVAVNG